MKFYPLIFLLTFNQLVHAQIIREPISQVGDLILNKPDDKAERELKSILKEPISFEELQFILDVIERSNISLKKETLSLVCAQKLSHGLSTDGCSKNQYSTVPIWKNESLDMLRKDPPKQAMTTVDSQDKNKIWWIFAAALAGGAAAIYATGHKLVVRLP
ncbi:MAG: hypothetical protein N2578_05085 [Bdellovibrionaceae bacterium]|nr:hypothetical protein [Pseudobdellovibrionaceae bacterium]